MSKLQVFNHTVAGGSLKTILVKSPRGSFERATTLPAAWKKCRIALLLSVRGLDSETAVPVAETVPNDGTHLTRFQLGLTSGGGMVGTEGTRFIGLTNYSGTPACVGYSSAAQRWSPFAQDTGISYNGATMAEVANGTTLALSGAYCSPPFYADPLAAQNFAGGLLLDFDASASGVLTLQIGCASNLTIGSNDAVATALAVLLTSVPNSSLTVNTNCWWDAANTYCGCTRLFLRLPYVQNRLVVHGYQVIKLA